MPTGYTMKLEKDWNVARWLKQDVVRALGVTVCLRDEGDLTQEQILKALTPDDKESYYAKSVRESEAALNAALGKSKKAWAEERRDAIHEAEEQMQRNKREVAEKAIEYRAAVKKLQEFKTKAKTEAGKSVATFGLDQLAIVADEYEPMEFYSVHLSRLIEQSVAEYAASQIDGHRRSLENAKEMLAREENANRERLAFYKDLLAECDALLK